MPPPTATQKPNKAVKKDADVKAPAAASNGTNGASAGAEEKRSGLTKPDQAKYNAEQEEIKKEMEAIKAKQVSTPLVSGGQG
jgi:hypothetical protein